MMFFPLLNIIGYEFSVVNGVIFYLFSGLLAIHTISKKVITEIDFNYHLKQNGLAFLIIFFIPFILGIISTTISSECPLGDGILFYLVISLPNIFFGYTIGLYISVMVHRFKKLLFLFVFTLILFIPLIEFYFYPQLYFYNLIIGFFPGTIYDEDLTVDRLLISYRILQISFFIALFFISHRVISKSIKKNRTFLLVAIFSVTFILIKPYINYSSNVNRIEKFLTGRVNTEHFNIIYSNSIDKESALYLALLHEYYLELITQQLQLKFDQKITSFIFGNEYEKRGLIGAGKADVAKPWLRQIFLNYSTFDETLKHEIVHIVAGKFGTTPFNVAENINPAMIEGLAMAIENDYDGFDVHFMAKTAYDSNFKVSFKKLFSGLNFFSNYSSVSYIYAGSFIKYLLDNYGITNLKNLYSDLDFLKYYKKDLAELEEEYKSFLDRIEIGTNKNTAQLYFGGKTIFKKHCARTAAFKTKKAVALFSKGNYSEAEKLFKEVYNYSGSYSAFIGWINSQIKLHKFEVAEKILISEKNKFINSPYKYNSELLLGDTYALNDKLNLAKSFYDSLLVQLPSIDYYNETFVRKYLLNKSISELKSFILGDRKKRFELLKELNSEHVIYETIPMMIYYCNDNVELKNLILFLRNKIEVNDRITSYAAMNLSRIAARLSYYEIAKELAIKSVAYKQDEMMLHSLIENLRLINWLDSFSEETLKKISIE